MCRVLRQGQEWEQVPVLQMLLPPDKLSYLSVKAQKWPRVRAGTGKAVVVLGGAVASL